MAFKQLHQKVVLLPPSNPKDMQLASATDRIEYIADMLLQLKDMAAVSKFHVLSGILEVAYQEARAQVRRS